jgi:NAD(P)H-flavin reductase/ferredoxin
MLQLQVLRLQKFERKMNYKIRIQGADGPSFEARQGQSLLDAAAEHGIELPYSCRKGVCGNCRGRVLEGQLIPGTEGGGHETGIQAPDEHLFCRAQAASDLLIAPREWRPVEIGARKIHTVRVFRNELVASDVSKLTLRLANGVRAKFAAGQYLQVVLPDGQRRAFSMANAPHDNDHVQLHIRHMSNGGFTATVVPELKKGDTLQVELPHGDFCLRAASARPLLFIAGGTGFAPIKSMIDSLLKTRSARPITLFWGARNPLGIYATEVIAKWQKLRPDLRFEPVISDPIEASAWPGCRGLVHETILESFASVKDYDVYACGAPIMVQATRHSLQTLRGLPAEQFFSDSFVSNDLGT